jgi:hypothetical protein
MNTFNTYAEAKKEITVENFNYSNVKEWIENYSHKQKVEFAIYCAELVIDLYTGSSDASKKAIQAAKDWLLNQSEENKQKCKDAAAYAAADAADAAAYAAYAATVAAADVAYIAADAVAANAAAAYIAANADAADAAAWVAWAAYAYAAADDAAAADAAAWVADAAYAADVAADAAAYAADDAAAYAADDAAADDNSVKEKIINYILSKYEQTETLKTKE